MARPASKYFTPVIRKIIEAKKKENISVDQKFKLVLRSQVISRAAGGLKAERTDVARFAEFFGKWKYQLALVPVALVLVIVAAQTFKMPVAMKSEVVVPVPGIPAGGGVDGREDLQSAGSQVPVQLPKIRTFAGRTVLPYSYFRGRDAGEAESLASDSPAIRFMEDSGAAQGDNLPREPDETVISGQAPEDAVTPQQALDNIATPQQAVQESVVPEPQVEQAPQAEEGLVTDFTQKLFYPPAPQEVPGQKKPGTAAGDVPEELADEGEEEGFSPEEQEVPETGGVTADTQEAQGIQGQEAQQQTVVTDIEVTQQASDGTTERQFVEISVPPETQAPAVQVYYGEAFEDEEKSIFESEVLAGMLRSVEFTLISVVPGEDGVVAVEMFMEDGSAKTRFFMKRAGKWVEVEYVRRYYFDDSLIYERSYLFEPRFGSGLVNNYKYPGLYR